MIHQPSLISNYFNLKDTLSYIILNCTFGVSLTNAIYINYYP